ncbi:Hypothetical protein CINCED_3A000734 [Cinara cedri]|uniref:Uncharacterized protein n=1 Tax=Cinara cedri TaxID=506608 RepID=A0A5E4N8Q0_9HEMI|nr:Hypothetical protein CINCED_3A000734 [Cinara cedri]
MVLSSSKNIISSTVYYHGHDGVPDIDRNLQKKMQDDFIEYVDRIVYDHIGFLNNGRGSGVAVFYADCTPVFNDVLAAGIRIRHLLRGNRFEIIQDTEAVPYQESPLLGDKRQGFAQISVVCRDSNRHLLTRLDHGVSRLFLRGRKTIVSGRQNRCLQTAMVESYHGTWSLNIMCVYLDKNRVCMFIAELMVLAVGFYYGYSARNANVLFDERHYLYYAITTELTFSSIFYAIRALYPISMFQNIKFVVAIVRGMLTNHFALLIIFGPKVWYQKKVNAELRLSALNPEIVETLKPDLIDGDIRELNIAEMTPDEIREEFNRVYTQLGLLRDKNVCNKNPHISKRKGGKKLPHRRFSLQKKGPRDNKVSIKIHQTTTDLDASEITEANDLNEQCKSPEDSVSSDENPQAGGDYDNDYNCQSATEIFEIYEPVIVTHKHKYVIGK